MTVLDTLLRPENWAEFAPAPHGADPDFWAWYIDPNAAESGWPPHRDKGMRRPRPDGSPKSLTVWLPLIDAIPVKVCMYVVPADRDPTYNSTAEGPLRFALTDIRALPAQAGSILVWTQAIVHWGAHAAHRDAQCRRPAKTDRSAIALLPAHGAAPSGVDSLGRWHSTQRFVTLDLPTPPHAP